MNIILPRTTFGALTVIVGVSIGLGACQPSKYAVLPATGEYPSRAIETAVVSPGSATQSARAGASETGRILRLLTPNPASSRQVARAKHKALDEPVASNFKKSGSGFRQMAAHPNPRLFASNFGTAADTSLKRAGGTALYVLVILGLVLGLIYGNTFVMVAIAILVVLMVVLAYLYVRALGKNNH